VLAWGRKQQVTDFAPVSIGYSADIDPDTGRARLHMTLGGEFLSFVYDDFRIEKSKR